MKIALDGRFYRAATGGIGRYSRELIKNLLALDGNNQYFLFLTPEDSAECKLYAPNLKRIVTQTRHFTLAEQLKFASEIGIHQPDVTHFLNFNHPLNFNRPFITTIHDLTMNFFPVGRQKNILLRQPYLAVMRHAASADAVIVPTETVKKDVVNYLHARPEKIEVIYEGVEMPTGALARPKKEYLAKIGITKPYILFVSQWRPHKGLAVLIEAFSQIKKQHDIQLVITGKANPQFPEIPAAINASPSRADIVTPGFVDDDMLDALYASTELFVFPSWYEGFGLPPLEAMARGIPVAASSTSVMPEILGEAAAYFDPRQAADMASTISRVLDNESERNDLKQKGLKQASKYSWQKMAQETLALYERVAQK